MIDFVIQCFAVSLSIAVGFVFIYGCCKAINRLFEGRSVPYGKITVKNFVADDAIVDVKLADGSVVKDRRFVGFADFGTKNVPFEFKTWLVLETDEGRSFIKPQTVRAIIEKKPNQSPEPTREARGSA